MREKWLFLAALFGCVCHIQSSGQLTMSFYPDQRCNITVITVPSRLELKLRAFHEATVNVAIPQQVYQTSIPIGVALSGEFVGKEQYFLTREKNVTITEIVLKNCTVSFIGFIGCSEGFKGDNCTEEVEKIDKIEQVEPKEKCNKCKTCQAPNEPKVPQEIRPEQKVNRQGPIVPLINDPPKATTTTPAPCGNETKQAGDVKNTTSKKRILPTPTEMTTTTTTHPIITKAMKISTTPRPVLSSRIMLIDKNRSEIINRNTIKPVATPVHTTPSPVLSSTIKPTESLTKTIYRPRIRKLELTTPIATISTTNPLDKKNPIQSIHSTTIKPIETTTRVTTPKPTTPSPALFSTFTSTDKSAVEINRPGKPEVVETNSSIAIQNNTTPPPALTSTIMPTDESPMETTHPIATEAVISSNEIPILETLGASASTASPSSSSPPTMMETTYFSTSTSEFPVATSTTPSPALSSTLVQEDESGTEIFGIPIIVLYGFIIGALLLMIAIAVGIVICCKKAAVAKNPNHV